jgi:hypothetical protein
LEVQVLAALGGGTVNSSSKFEIGATSVLVNVSRAAEDGSRNGVLGIRLPAEGPWERPFKLFAGETHVDLQVLVDRSVVEVWVAGGRATIQGRSYGAVGHTAVHLIAREMPVVIAKYSIYSMGCGWTSDLPFKSDDALHPEGYGGGGGASRHPDHALGVGAGQLDGRPPSSTRVHAATPPSVVGWDRHWLLKLRTEIGVSGKIRVSLRPALHALHKAAANALGLEPPSVVSANGASIPGCDNCSKHDLRGLATYAWPCGTPCNTSRYSQPHQCKNWWERPHYKTYGKCDNKTGLPWEQHDGYIMGHKTSDPDMTASDHMSDAVTTLALAHYLLGNATFGAKAARLLQVWFVGDATSMNPNVDHTAIIPGTSIRNGSCIVTTHRWNSRLTDAVALLRCTGALTAEVSQQLDDWNARYLYWLLTSKTGLKEANMKQNHATWHTVESAALAYSTNDTAAAAVRLARLTSGSTRPALGHQIEPSGLMPFEAERSDGVGYSCMNMAALFNAATIGRNLRPHASPDLFTYTNASGGGSGSIRKALDYLLQFATNSSKPWPYTQLTKAPPWTELAPQMLIAARVYDEPEYERMIQQLPWPGGAHWPQQESWDVDVSRLLFPSIADPDLDEL